MKFKIFTLKHADQDLIDCSTRFTSAESTQVIQNELQGIYISKNAILHDLFSRDSPKLIALDFLIRQIQQKNYSTILSLGFGNCSIEYLLSHAFLKKTTIIATDFNNFHIGNAKKFFPEIISEKFDFYSDTIEQLSKRLNAHFDFAYFLNSSYVMDDTEYISLLTQLREAGVCEIIDLSSAIIPPVSVPRAFLGDLKNALTGSYRGKFHGYMRTKNDFRRIYRRSGLSVSHEYIIGPYGYVSVLNIPGKKP